MNVVDATLDGKLVSRMQYQQYLLHRILSEQPCGTQVSIGIFAGVSVAALYTPIEVCENFAAIEDTIDHLDWRTGWSGNSRLREGTANLAKLIRSFPEPAQVVYMTDGEEAPKLHAFNTRDLAGFQGAKDWLYVGIGSDKGTAIPKMDENNQVIGYWSAESFAMQPGIAQISEANIGVRDDNVSVSVSDRFISKLDEKNLQYIAEAVGANYVNGESWVKVSDAMKKQPAARREKAAFGLQWLLAGLSGLLFLAAYLPKHPVKEFRHIVGDFFERRKRQALSSAALKSS